MDPQGQYAKVAQRTAGPALATAKNGVAVSGPIGLAGPPPAQLIEQLSELVAMSTAIEQNAIDLVIRVGLMDGNPVPERDPLCGRRVITTVGELRERLANIGQSIQLLSEYIGA